MTSSKEVQTGLQVIRVDMPKVSSTEIANTKSFKKYYSKLKKSYDTPDNPLSLPSEYDLSWTFRICDKDIIIDRAQKKDKRSSKLEVTVVAQTWYVARKEALVLLRCEPWELELLGDSDNQSRQHKNVVLHKMRVSKASKSIQKRHKSKRR